MLIIWKTIVKTSILPKAIYRFNAILIKIVMAFFTNNLKSICNHEKSLIAKAILRQKKLEASHSLISGYITKL